jgi:hypothetical protein
MARAKLPKELIKKYGISKKAWAVFRGRNAGRKVKKVRRTTRRAHKVRPRASRRQVTHMARRRGGRRKGGKRGRKMGIPSIATIIVGASALRELGILDLLANAAGPGANIIDEGTKWAANVKAGDMVDAFLPAIGLMIFRKFMPKGPSLGPIRTW